MLNNLSVFWHLFDSQCTPDALSASLRISHTGMAINQIDRYFPYTTISVISDDAAQSHRFDHQKSISATKLARIKAINQDLLFDATENAQYRAYLRRLALRLVLDRHQYTAINL